MTYQKYRWDESRGDEYAAWGGSWWYFEFGPDGWPRRQVEVYDGGVTLRYGPDHLEDDFSCFSYRHKGDIDSFSPEPVSVTAEEFDSFWLSVKSMGDPSTRD